MGSPRPNLIAASIRIALLKRGFTREDLGSRTGLSLETISNVIGGNSESRIARIKIETLMEEPFWTPVDSFHKWRAIAEALGADPRLLTLRELKALTRKKLPSFPRHQPIRGALLTRIEQHFSAPHPEQATT